MKYAYTWVALAIFSLAACGGSGGGGPASKALQIGQFNDVGRSDDLPDSFVRNSNGDQIEFWYQTENSKTELVQSLFLASDGSTTRTYYDNGLPTRVVNESTGRQLNIVQAGDRLDFLEYDASGNFIDGRALALEDDGDAVLAEFEGEPPFKGQLTGQLTGGSVTASFSVLPDSQSGLGRKAGLGDALQDLFNALDGAAESKALKAFSVRQSSGLMTAALHTVISELGIQQTGGAISAATLDALAEAAASWYLADAPLYDQLETTELPALLQLWAQTFSQDTSLRTFARDVTIALQNGAFPPLSLPALPQFVDTANEQSSAIVPASSLTPLIAITDIVAAQLDGFGVDQNGAAYQLTGSVETDGSLLVQTAANASNQLQISGTYNRGSETFGGSFSGDIGSGSASGDRQELGGCDDVRESGGQGTFSFSQNLAQTSGTFDFFYDAFGIPDAFVVTDGNGDELFNTNGLVSGSQTVTLPINGTPIIFVQVSAPEPSTSWDYSVSCP